MLALVGAGDATTQDSPITVAIAKPETANIFENRVMCASLSTGVPSGVTAPDPNLPDKDVR